MKESKYHMYCGFERSRDVRTIRECMVWSDKKIYRISTFDYGEVMENVLLN